MGKHPGKTPAQRRALDASAGVTLAITYHGRRPIKLRTAWDRARDFAGLGPEVTPHILRHTRATWLMHEGVPIAEAAGSLGMSPGDVRARLRPSPSGLPAQRREGVMAQICTKTIGTSHEYLCQT